jgi:hypothetical protein
MADDGLCVPSSPIMLRLKTRSNLTQSPGVGVLKTPAGKLFRNSTKTPKMNPPTPSNNGDPVAGQAIDEHLLLLTNEQTVQLQTFRNGVRQCDNDADKFRLYARTRTKLLYRHTQFAFLIALFKRIMADECIEYRTYKKNKRKAKKAESEEANEWERFIHIAANRSSAIRDLLPSLRAIVAYWGHDKLDHYN